MLRLGLFLVGLLITASPQSAAGQISGPLILAEGKCDRRTQVTVDGNDSSFSCDSASITRSDRGSVLIQFTDKAGDDGRILGFAGTIEGKQGWGADSPQVMAVERLYLAGGAKPVQVSRGTCILNWTGLQRTGGKVTSVLCSARANADGRDFIAVVVLEVSTMSVLTP